jgi:hypothetical protein
MLGSYPINFDKDTQDWTYSRGVFNAMIGCMTCKFRQRQ